jgi:hypothetical protein
MLIREAVRRLATPLAVAAATGPPSPVALHAGIKVSLERSRWPMTSLAVLCHLLGRKRVALSPAIETGLWPRWWSPTMRGSPGDRPPS